MLVAVSNLRSSTNVQARSRDVTSCDAPARAGREPARGEPARLRHQRRRALPRLLARGEGPRARRDATGHGRALRASASRSISRCELSALVRAYVNEYGIPLIRIFRFDPSAARAPVATREGAVRGDDDPHPARAAARGRGGARLDRRRLREAAAPPRRSRSGSPPSAAPPACSSCSGSSSCAGSPPRSGRSRSAPATSRPATSRPACRRAARPRSER